MKRKNKPKKESEQLKQFPYFGLLLILIVSGILIYVRIGPFVQGNQSLPFSPNILFDDPDSCCHARRILYIAQHNLQLPFRDPLIAYPHGAIPIWSPFYDWISAFPSYVLSLGSPSDYFVIRVATVMNVIFGLIQLFFIGLLLYKIGYGLSIAAIAVFLVGITNRQTAYTNLKTLDHNGLALMLFTVALYQMYYLLVDENNSKKLQHALIPAIVLALLFWTWPGAYLYISVIFCIELLYIFLKSKSNLCNHLTLVYALAGILICPLSFINCSYSKEYLKFEYVSLFTVLFVLSLSLFFSIIKSVYDLKAESIKAVVIVKCCIAVAGLIMISYYSFNPLIEGFKYAEAQNTWLSTVMESKPLLYLTLGSIKTFAMSKAITNLGYLIFVFPIAFCLILIRIIKIPFALYCTLVVNTFIFSFLAFKQLKYAVEFAIPYGIVLALFIAWICGKIGTKAKIPLIEAMVIIILLSFIPFARLFKQEIFMPHYAYQNGYQWLRNETNTQKAEINSGIKAAEGVMAPWDFGHHLQLYSQIGTIADNFGFIYLDNNPWEGFYDMARFFFAENENDAVSILKKYKCKYVVVPADSSVFEPYAVLIGKSTGEYFDYKTTSDTGEKQIRVELKDRFYETMGFRLSEINGSSNPASNPQMMNFAALKHFRLVYELPGFSLKGKNFPPGMFKIYQNVNGATLEVPENGNFYYQAESIIINKNGRNFYYRQHGTLNEKIIVPYSTQPSDKYPYAKYYSVTINGQIYGYDNVPEEEVLEGTAPHK